MWIRWFGIGFCTYAERSFSEIVLIDADKDKAEGEAMDISHGIPFARPMKIYAGGYDDVADAAIIVVSAGAGQKPGETRLDLVNKMLQSSRASFQRLQRETSVESYLSLQTL